jgi:hypothetical protein
VFGLDSWRTARSVNGFTRTPRPAVERPVTELVMVAVIIALAVVLSSRLSISLQVRAPVVFHKLAMSMMAVLLISANRRFIQCMGMNVMTGFCVNGTRGVAQKNRGDYMMDARASRFARSIGEPCCVSVGTDNGVFKRATVEAAFAVDPFGGTHAVRFKKALFYQQSAASHAQHDGSSLLLARSSRSSKRRSDSPMGGGSFE